MRSKAEVSRSWSFSTQRTVEAEAHKQLARRSRGEPGAGGRSPCRRRSRRPPRSATGLAGHQRARLGSGPTIIQLVPTVLAASEAPVASVGQPWDLTGLGDGPAPACGVVDQVE